MIDDQMIEKMLVKVTFSSRTSGVDMFVLNTLFYPGINVTYIDSKRK